MERARRPGVVLAVAGALCAAATLGGPAPASHASTASHASSNPQPEVKPITFGLAMSPGSAAIERGGSLVAAYDVDSGNGKTVVCLLTRGAGQCSHKSVLTPLQGDQTFGTPEVFVTSANHVIVLQQTCCDSLSDSSGDDLIYTSADGGKTFAPPVRVGTIGVDAAAVVGNQLIFIGGDDGAGAQVQSVQLTPSVANAGPPVTTQPKEAFDVGITGYHGGVLVASDSGSPNATYVEYAAAAARPFTSASSFATVGAFSGEQLLGLSGRALLTVQTGGSHWVRLRLFNGSQYGAPVNVPGTSGGGPEWFVVDQDPSGTVHVFCDRAHAAVPYQLAEYTTSNGSRWAGPVDLGDTRGLTSDVFAASLDSRGSGLVIGTEPAVGYPVLAAQSVTFSLRPKAIKKGKPTTASGKVSPATAGLRVTLQVQGRTGKWFTAATTREKIDGSFSFTIKGKSSGTFKYRAVAADLAGYLQFGYSGVKQLRVTG